MSKKRGKKLFHRLLEKPLKFVVLLLLGAASALGLYLFFVAHHIHTRFEQMKSASASEFYGTYEPLHEDQKLTPSDLQRLLSDAGLKELNPSQEILPGQYSVEKDGSEMNFLVYRPDFSAPGKNLGRLFVKINLEPESDGLFSVDEIVRLDNKETISHFELPPKIIANFQAGRLRTQSFYPLSEIPVSMRLAVMAIEDTKFLEHKGVSFRAIARALLRDIRAGRFVEGGSTITQQLMKNLFFSREKSVFRKISEAIYAVVGEAIYSKEAILEAYLNEIYLGQLSTHEIHGIPEGARYYFNTSVSDLKLAQSATLAAINQLPNMNNPRRSPEKVIKRRNLVLKKMYEVGFILEGEYEDAIKEPLGTVPQDRSLDDIDYFVDLVLERLPNHLKSTMETQRLTLYTTLNPFMQNAGSRALKENLAAIEKQYKTIKKKAERGLKLQGALIAIDVARCGVLALQGGQSYRQTQFNRVLQGKRQPGSLLKPFVYLAAYSQVQLEPPITPDTLIEDSPFEWKYDKQTWAPKNYDNIFRGNVTTRLALEDSLNVPTAKLAQMIGIPPIVDAMKSAGITSPLNPVPSISLGSTEVTPIELARAYTTLANLGKRCEPNPIGEVFDEKGNLLLKNEPNFETTLPAESTYMTTEVLKGVLTRGTAKWAASTKLPLENFAGKTGTTNDYKDAWFAGFSPQILVLVWVGYDEEEKVGLTGAAAALPVWVDFIRRNQMFLKPTDFKSPS